MSNHHWNAPEHSKKKKKTKIKFSKQELMKIEKAVKSKPKIMEGKTYFETKGLVEDEIDIKEKYGFLEIDDKNDLIDIIKNNLSYSMLKIDKEISLKSTIDFINLLQNKNINVKIATKPCILYNKKSLLVKMYFIENLNKIQDNPVFKNAEIVFVYYVTKIYENKNEIKIRLAILYEN